MSLREALALELRVAFSRNAQPIWFRVIKWVIIIGGGSYLWRTPYFWWVFSAALVLAISLHLLWRTKTRRWTEAWGGWDDLETTRRAGKGS